jgi:uncharacterized Zn finger protein
MTGAVTHPPFGPRRSRARSTTWWGKAWVRALEEAAYAERELREGRALARAGAVGGIAVEPGSVVAAVTDRGEVRSVQVRVPVLDPADLDALVEVVAAESGRVAALLGGDLPHLLVEHSEEAGVELLPYAGELDAACSCDAWTQPCAHALALLSQVAWLLDADPLVLLQIRGLPREELLTRLHALTDDPDDTDGAQPADPIETAADAALRARRALELLDAGVDADHLL